MKKIFRLSLLTFTSSALLFSSCKKQSDPVIELVGEQEMIIYIGETFTEPGYKATDYKGRDITDKLQVSGNVESKSGHFTRDYNVSDKKNNHAHVSRGITRGFKNSDLAGTYMVVQTSNNGGVTQNYSGTVTIAGSDIVSVQMNNMNSLNAPVMMNANIYGNATQFSVPDQVSNGSTITLGTNGSVSNANGQTKITISFQTFNGTITRNHTAIWTKL